MVGTNHILNHIYQKRSSFPQDHLVAAMASHAALASSRIPTSTRLPSNKNSYSFPTQCLSKVSFLSFPFQCMFDSTKMLSIVALVWYQIL